MCTYISTFVENCNRSLFLPSQIPAVYDYYFPFSDSHQLILATFIRGYINFDKAKETLDAIVGDESSDMYIYTPLLYAKDQTPV